MATVELALASCALGASLVDAPTAFDTVATRGGGLVAVAAEQPATLLLTDPAPLREEGGGGKKKARRRKRGKAKRRAAAEGEEGEGDEEEEGQPATTAASNELLRRAGWPVEVRYARGRGRYAVAARAVAAGAVVLRERAFAAAVAAPQQGLACHACFRYAPSGGATLRHTCARCGQVSFCSAACAAPTAAGRVVHPKAECEALQRLHTTCNLKGFSVDEVAEARLLIRILVLRWIATSSANVEEEKEEEEDGERESGTCRRAVETSFAHFIELMSNKHSFGSAAINRFRQRAFLVTEALSGRATSDVLRGLDVDEIVEYIGRLESNTFARYSTTKRKTVNYGSALYNCAAMFNHSCFPSVVRQFDGQHLTLRALRPLNPGDELTMTYIPLRDDTPERQNELQQHYHFACRCQRCEARGAEVERYMEACLLCPNDKRECDGLLVCLDDDDDNDCGDKPETIEGATTRRQRCLACGFTRDIDVSRLTPTFT